MRTNTMMLFVLSISTPLSFIHASTQPKFTVSEVISNGNNIQISKVGSATTVYEIINNTNITRTLTMSPIAGISQNTQATGACGFPFTLESNGGHCFLYLAINGSELSSDVHKGPIICATEGNNNSPSPFLCSQPSQKNILNINLGTAFAYIGDAGNESGTRCHVNPLTGDFTDCIQGVLTPYQVEQIALTSNGQQAYIVNADSTTPTIETCAIHAITGSFYNCYTTSATSLNTPQTITLNTLETQAYITNFGSNNITKCLVDSTTYNLYNCSITGTSITQPQGLILNAANTQAYITNSTGSPVVTQCDVNPTSWTLENCTDSGATLASSSANPDSIVMDSNEKFAYITSGYNSSGLITQCTIDENNGHLTACINSNASNLNSPFGIAINADNSFIYVVNFGNSTVTTCSVSKSTGLLSDCKNSGATTLNFPTSISLR